MNTTQISALSLLVLLFMSSYVLSAQADAGISIINLKVQPYAVRVGDVFVINATLVNNSPNTINVFNACSMPFTLELDNHTASKLKRVCNWMSPRVILNPGESVTGSTMNSQIAYVAASPGTANATVIFSYSAFNPTSKDFNNNFTHVSKSILFTVSDQSAASVAKSPLAQFRSGITAKDTVCNEGLELVIKAEDGSPACMSANTAQKLTERGWAQLLNK
ncbi:MAG: hypothetical protein KGI27_03465 [Thaumarchaeota archaeon]|nr:hypothetical protein [Nitrososphaerota archaeon]